MPKFGIIILILFSSLWACGNPPQGMEFDWQAMRERAKHECGLVFAADQGWIVLEAHTSNTLKYNATTFCSATKGDGYIKKTTNPNHVALQDEKLR